MNMVVAAALPADVSQDGKASRAKAAAEWQDAFDPDHLTDPKAVAEAAGRAPLIERYGKPAFEPVSFADLVTFIAEMPF